MSDYYEQYWSPDGFRPTGHAYAALTVLLERVVTSSSDCLDVGCGDGRTSGVLLASNARRYVGVDVSEQAVALARSLGLRAERITDAARLPFDEQAFDVVVCLEVLEHLFEPHGAAAEMLRVLRPGGSLLVTVPNIAHWRQRLELGLVGRWNPYGDDKAWRQPWRDPHIRFFTRAALGRMLSDCGFEVDELGGLSGPFLHEIPGLRTLAPGDHPSWLYRRLVTRVPGLFARRLYAIVRKVERA
jgi:methionine biosynthesis protein MetW